MTEPVADESQALRDEIERTRADLGQTVEALAAKTDVKRRAEDAAGRAADQVKDKAVAVKEQVKEKAQIVQEQVKETAQTVQEQVGETAHVVLEKTAEAAGSVGDHVRSGVTAVHDTVAEADMPDTLRKPWPRAVLAGVIAALTAAVFLFRRNRRS